MSDLKKMGMFSKEVNELVEEATRIQGVDDREDNRTLAKFVDDRPPRGTRKTTEVEIVPFQSDNPMMQGVGSNTDTKSSLSSFNRFFSRIEKVCNDLHSEVMYGLVDLNMQEAQEYLGKELYKYVNINLLPMSAHYIGTDKDLLHFLSLLYILSVDGEAMSIKRQYVVHGESKSWNASSITKHINAVKSDKVPNSSKVPFRQIVTEIFECRGEWYNLTFPQGLEPAYEYLYSAKGINEMLDSNKLFVKVMEDGKRGVLTKDSLTVSWGKLKEEYPQYTKINGDTAEDMVWKIIQYIVYEKIVF